MSTYVNHFTQQGPVVHRLVVAAEVESEYSRMQEDICQLSAVQQKELTEVL